VGLPETGQTSCYDTSIQPVGKKCGLPIGLIPLGQDGAYSTGVVAPSPRFSVAGNGNCQVDNLTGLMWTKNANLAGAATTWQGALDYANSLNISQFCGFSDWRLPNRKELRTLVNYGVGDNGAALDAEGFVDVQIGSYWSSTSAGGSLAWTVGMRDGSVGTGIKSHKVILYNVWPVRGGQ
jgi:hypothetical protein